MVNDLYLHIRVVIGVILGLSIGKLLQGLAELAEHPRLKSAWWVHLGWVGWALLSVVGFWWWEFQLSTIMRWTFGIYLFIFTYASCYFMIAALLFPARMGEYAAYKEYLISRRYWLFGFIALTFILDIGDTLLKGADYLNKLGPVYFARTAAMISICVIGAFSKHHRTHAILVITALAIQIAWFFTEYNTLFQQAA